MRCWRGLHSPPAHSLILQQLLHSSTAYPCGLLLLGDYVKQVAMVIGCQTLIIPKPDRKFTNVLGHPCIAGHNFSGEGALLWVFGITSTYSNCYLSSVGQYILFLVSPKLSDIDIRINAGSSFMAFASSTSSKIFFDLVSGYSPSGISCMS